MKFELHTIDSAPESVKADLELAQKTYGNIPNLYRGLANHPAALKIYLKFNENLKEFGYLQPVEQQIVYIIASAENNCTYCVGAHSVLANMVNISEPTFTELRELKPLSDPKLNALRNFTLSVMKNNGWVPDTDIKDFQDAGYNQQHVLEVLTILAQKTLSNYFNHLALTPLDDMFSEMAWTR